MLLAGRLKGNVFYRQTGTRVVSGSRHQQEEHKYISEGRNKWSKTPLSTALDCVSGDAKDKKVADGPSGNRLNRILRLGQE